jgi:hypothetical protein
MTDGTRVPIAKVKGRPMLPWVGTRPLGEARSFPAQPLTPQITDWRAMVDSVFIDVAYDGEVFNVAEADIPERRQDLVSGSYVVARPSGSQLPIAVRITDILGEEGLVVVPR